MHAYIHTNTHTGKDGGCFNIISSNAVVQISGEAQLNNNAALGFGGLIYLGPYSRARVMDRVNATMNVAATGGAFYLAPGSQVGCSKTLHAYFIWALALI